MSDGVQALQALPVAVADIAVGGLLAQHVSPALGLVLATVGVLVLFTAAYRTVRRPGRRGPRGRQPA